MLALSAAGGVGLMGSSEWICTPMLTAGALDGQKEA